MPTFRTRVLLLLLATCACFAPLRAQPKIDAQQVFAKVPKLRPEVISERPHDPTAFTQGFEINDGNLYESTGMYGRSSLRETDPATGRVLRGFPLPEQVFGEGITFVGDEIYMLTWKQQVAIVFSRETFRSVRQIKYKGEGWGLAYDGTHLIMSDGSERLTFRDVKTFDVASSITVNLLGQPIKEVNELEYVDGVIWANVWRTDLILKIDPATGNVLAVVNASNLLTAEERKKADVLNGIAYDRRTKTFFLTGKNWPKTFEVVFVPDG